MDLMKNGLNKPAIQRIANALSQLLPSFNQQGFIKEASAGLSKLELKERVAHIITALHNYLPQDFNKTAKLLQRLPKLWDYGNSDDALRGFAAWPLIDYIGVYGLNHPKIALETLSKITELFSAEFAIRPFLLEHPALTHQQLAKWVNHRNEHVRRLASEGTRPRLPWGMQLKPYIKDPSCNLPLLEILKNDSSLYVRRSVANHLNDISKDHPKIVIQLCKKWQIKASDEVNWVIKHATRTLVKAGHPEVFSLLGYTENVQMKPAKLTLKKTEIQIGDSLEFELTLQSNTQSHQSIVVDFAIHFVKANGQRKPKVFKLKTIELPPHKTLSLTKKHSIKRISTRNYYSGKHLLEIFINGKAMAAKEFMFFTAS